MHLKQRDDVTRVLSIVYGCRENQIARKLGVHHSTISRKIKRNTVPDFKQLYSCR
ncbi:helix-turn-helix domain-containing protein [Yersinia pseudotuberculosis]|uniref:helix-turn-helix domain-containing protein n=1 Tax=Yersinia pseudotuberculosis TaxID=633 RepID=UPI0009B989B0